MFHFSFKTLSIKEHESVPIPAPGSSNFIFLSVAGNKDDINFAIGYEVKYCPKNSL